MAEESREYITNQSLRSNLLLHLFNLWDNGLVNSGDISNIMSVLDQVPENTSNNTKSTQLNTLKSCKKCKEGKGICRKPGHVGHLSIALLNRARAEAIQNATLLVEQNKSNGRKKDDPLGMNEINKSPLLAKYPVVQIPSIWHEEGEDGEEDGESSSEVEEDEEDKSAKKRKLRR